MSPIIRRPTGHPPLPSQSPPGWPPQYHQDDEEYLLSILLARMVAFITDYIQSMWSAATASPPPQALHPPPLPTNQSMPVGLNYGIAWVQVTPTVSKPQVPWVWVQFQNSGPEATP